ncbi:MAG: hypothetical protein CO031_02800 [Candidatus Nealsonbacteria bacterium CG_4_9_14_0_2_um_filter_37_38]|nr:MAG: hypothetical protein COV63_02770 [Candidatus Nealsonbacteria bacterium CG11_big_fil_rev_8_21_14_0_20_37_68]PJC51418.1 MAG: hypothetical protein CO031_02800 [Candidatus Nealsonbacteria bacterium CG_4_9_14_0_2_um_filter_37_38]
MSYILLGILQGIFEWIPISSEGVVALVAQFLPGLKSPLDLALFLHLGTALAVLIYFGKDWMNILSFKDKNLLQFLIIATLISLAVGFPVYKLLKGVAIGAGLLLVMGLGLLFTAYFQRTSTAGKPSRPAGWLPAKLNLNPNQLAAICGFLQGLSVIPGLSRSGSTIFGLALGGVEPFQILKISYMMSLPVVLASSCYLFLENPILICESWRSLFFSFSVGILSLHFLIKISQKINFSKFALIFGILCLIGAAIEFII